MLLDNIDKDLLKLKWHKHNAGYMQTGGGNYKRYAHRIVLERKLGRPLNKGELTDHINRDKLDNRRANLRVADKSINTINRDKRPDNTSGYIGVYLHRPQEWEDNDWAMRWKFTIERKGHKKYTSKLYKTPQEAHEAREKELKNYIY